MNWHHMLFATFILVGMMATTTGVFIGRTLKPDVSSNPRLLSGLRPPATQLESSLGILLNKTPEELEQVNTSTLYLSCIAGMPGSEHIDLDGAQAHLAELAKMVKSETEKASKYQHSINKEFKDTPESKLLVMMEVLRDYEQNARRRGQSLPENLFMRNKVDQAPEAHFATPVEAAMAGRLRDYHMPKPEDSIPDFPHSEVVALNNPILLVTLGQMLGYPVYLVKAPDHLFARWQGEDAKEAFNIDEIGKYGAIPEYPIRPDSDYERPPEAEVQEGGYFKPLNHAETMALFLQARGNFLRTKSQGFDAELAYAAAHRFASDIPIYRENMIEVVGEEMRIREMKWKDMAEHNGWYLNLNPPKPDKTVIP